MLHHMDTLQAHHADFIHLPDCLIPGLHACRVGKQTQSSFDNSLWDATPKNTGQYDGTQECFKAKLHLSVSMYLCE